MSLSDNEEKEFYPGTFTIPANELNVVGTGHFSLKKVLNDSCNIKKSRFMNFYSLLIVSRYSYGYEKKSLVKRSIPSIFKLKQEQKNKSKSLKNNIAH